MGKKNIFVQLIFSILIIIFLASCSQKPKEAANKHNAAYWKSKLKNVKIGMKKEIIEKILPPYKNPNLKITRVLYFTTPPGQCYIYDLDKDWKVTLCYNFPETPDFSNKTFVDFDNPDIRLAYKPRLNHHKKKFNRYHAKADKSIKKLSTPVTSGFWRLKKDRSNYDSKTKSKLLSLGYLDGYKPATDKKNVTIYKKAKSYNSYNFFISGSAEKVFLMDMNGKILHHWDYVGLPLYPFKVDFCLRRAHLFENGDMILILDNNEMEKVDNDSHLIWKNKLSFHHDCDVDNKGFIYALINEKRLIPQINPNQLVIVDSIVKLTSSGKLVKKYPLYELFKKSSYAPLLKDLPRKGDIFHTNTIEIFDGKLVSKSKLFKKGNILISIRNNSTIAILDLVHEKVLWALKGQWAFQHQPTLLANGNLLLFDNVGSNGQSKVIEFNPFTQKIVWSYHGKKWNDFFSPELGVCQRLPNGNTLITESCAGRAFEVTPKGEKVWEYYNPNQAGKHNELIATLFELVRLPKDFPLKWLSKK